MPDNGFEPEPLAPVAPQHTAVPPTGPTTALDKKEYGSVQRK